MSFAAKPYLRSVSIDPEAGLDLDNYPFSIPAVREMGVLEPHADVTNVFTYLDELPPGGKPSRHLRSHGEAFMDVMREFSGDGLYLLDEPEAALSPNRQLAALTVIDGLVKEGAQFIIATHSPILLAYPRAKILSFDDCGISHIDYEDTEHYAVTRDFLNHYPRRLQQLLDDC
jgi:predicted ATPase